MSDGDLGTLVVVLLTAGLVAAAVAWTRIGRAIWTPLAVAALVAAAAGAAAHGIELGRATHALEVAVAALLALAGGGPLTTLVFDAVDRNEPTLAPDTTLVTAGAVLRGGAWIGALERLATFASIAAGWPEGVAVVLAVKGLGRYPELRNPGAAERFIIGTFTSVLWAGGCAGVVLLSR